MAEFDESPQFMKMYVPQTGVDAFTSLKFETPVIPTTSGKYAIVMEILKVFYQFTNYEPDKVSALVDTTINAQLTRDQQTAIQGLDDEDLIARVGAEYTPVGRFGTSEEIADITAFLASDRNGFVTGCTIEASGGAERFF